MKLAVAALMVASAQADNRRSLHYTNQAGATVAGRAANANCTAGTIANLMTTPAGCVSSKLLGPLTLAGFDLSASSLSGLTAFGAYMGDTIYNLTAIADTVPGVAAVVASLSAVHNVNVSHTIGGLAQYNGMSAGLRGSFNQNYSKAACAAVKPILESGASCVKAACRDAVLNLCDGDNSTDGGDSLIGGYITKLSQISKFWCARESATWANTDVWPTCESFFPTAAFGTYVVPTTNSSSNTTAPASAASSVEVGMLAAASIVVAALAF